MSIKNGSEYDIMHNFIKINQQKISHCRATSSRHPITVSQRNMYEYSKKNLPRTNYPNLNNNTNVIQNYFSNKKFPGSIYLKDCKNSLNNLNISKKNNSKKEIFRYYEKEELIDNVINLKKTINKLNQEKDEQRMQINRQKQEISKQNQMLNEYNIKSFLNNFEKETENFNKLFNSASPTNYRNNKQQRSNSCKEIENSKDNNNKYYKKLVINCERKSQEITRLKNYIDVLKFSHNSLVSNLKMQYKDLQTIYNKKKEELSEIKKTIKCTKYNEILIEKETYEKELMKMKTQLLVYSNHIKYLNKIITENKSAKVDINKKDIKIKKLENQISENQAKFYEKLEKYKKEIDNKNRKILNLENELKKQTVLIANLKQKQNLSKITFKSNKYNNDINKEMFLLFIEMEKRGIKNIDTFISNVLNLMDEKLSFNENKQNYYKNILKYLNIDFNEGDNKNMLYNFVSEIFMDENELCNLNDIKNKQINLLKYYFERYKNNTDINNDILNKIKQKISEIIGNKTLNMSNRYINFEEMISFISEIKLEEFLIQLLIITKDEKYFNLMDCKKLFDIVNDENNKEEVKNLYNNESYSKIVDNDKVIAEEENKEEDSINEINSQRKEVNSSNKIQINKENQESNDSKENKKNIENQEINNNNDSKENKKNQENQEINDNNIVKGNSNETQNFEKEENKKNDENDKNDENNITSQLEEIINDNEKNQGNIINIDEIFLKLSKLIVIEGSTSPVYINSIKEEIEDNDDKNKKIDVINSEKLFEFLNNKNIIVNDDEKNGIIKKYKIMEDKNNNIFYLDFNKIVEKLFELIQKNDDNMDDNDDFMQKIKNIDIDGLD